MLGQPRIGLAGWFVYPLTITLAATASVINESTIQVYQNSDFELHQIQFFDTQSTNPGQFSVRFGTINVFFSPDFVLTPTVFGTGNLPHRLVQPVVFPRGSFILVRLRNETANARTIYLAFEGINVNVT